MRARLIERSPNPKMRRGQVDLASHALYEEQSIALRGHRTVAQLIDASHPNYVHTRSAVDIHPACDYWARGAHSGVVTSTPTVCTGRHLETYVYVKLDGFNARPVAIERRMLKPAGTEWSES